MKTEESKRWIKYFLGILAAVLLNIFLCFSVRADGLAANVSNIKCSSANGCSSQTVYTYTTFYGNVWNGGNQGYRMKTVNYAIYKNGRKIDSKSLTASGYYDYVSAAFYVTEAGTYTANVNATLIGGRTITLDTFTFNVVSYKYGSSASLSASNLSLDMTGIRYSRVTVTVTGYTPDNCRLKVSSKYALVSTSWSEYNPSGGNNSVNLTVTAKTSGTSTIKIYYYQGSSLTSDSLISTMTLKVTTGPVYQVVYKANGGSSAPSSQKKYYGKTLTLSKKKPVRTGYTFVGWSTNKKASSAEYKAGASYTANKGLTLYAVWRKGTKIQVKSSYKLIYKNNKTFSLKAKSGGKLTYKSSNTSVAAVSSRGVVTMKSIGTATITITSVSGKSKTTAKVKVTFTPDTVVIKSLKSPGKGQISLVWKRIALATGYEIEYSKSSKFPKASTKTGWVRTNPSKQNITSMNSGLPSGTYFFRMRSYRVVNGKNIYGSWSNVKKVKVK